MRLSTVLCALLFLVGCTGGGVSGPIATEAEAITAAKHALEHEVQLMGPAARYDPESARIEEEQSGTWLVSFGGVGEYEGQEMRFRVAVDKETGAITFPGLPGFSTSD